MLSFLVFKLLVFIGLFLFLTYYFVYKIVKKLLDRRRTRVKGEFVTATVISYKKVKDSAGVTRYYPILQYTTKKGETVTAQSKKERYEKYEVGKALPIYYLPWEPTEFYISGLFPYIKLTGLLFGIFAGVVLLIEIYRIIHRLIVIL